jgi:hypothetical protein
MGGIAIEKCHYKGHQSRTGEHLNLGVTWRESCQACFHIDELRGGKPVKRQCTGIAIKGWLRDAVKCKWASQSRRHSDISKDGQGVTIRIPAMQAFVGILIEECCAGIQEHNRKTYTVLLTKPILPLLQYKIHVAMSSINPRQKNVFFVLLFAMRGNHQLHQCSKVVRNDIWNKCEMLRICTFILLKKITVARIIWLLCCVIGGGLFSGVFADIGSSWVPYTTFRAVPILASNSRRYSYSKNDSRTHRYGESAIEFFKRKLSVSMIRRVVDSPHQWYRQSPTPPTVESESRRLRVSPVWRVDDSAYCWVGESTTLRISDTGSRYSKKKLIWCRFSALLTTKSCP